MSKWHGGKGSKQRPTDHEKYNDNWDRIFSKNQKIKQKQVTELNWDGDEEGERANWYGYADQDEDEEGDVSGDALPQNSFRPG